MTDNIRYTPEELAAVLRQDPAYKVLTPQGKYGSGTTDGKAPLGNSVRIAKNEGVLCQVKGAPDMSRQKYGNQRTEYNGRVYDSKKEALFAADLDLRVKAGELLSWIPQVSIPLPGKRRYRVDFLVVWSPTWLNIPEGPHCDITFVEIKGRDLPMGKLKREMTEEIYKIKITVI